MSDSKKLYLLFVTVFNVAFVATAKIVGTRMLEKSIESYFEAKAQSK